MSKVLTIVTFVLSLMLIVNITLYNIVTIKIPDASASIDPSSIPNNLTLSNATQAIQTATQALANATQQATQHLGNASQQVRNQTILAKTNQVGLESFGNIMAQSTLAIAVMLTLPLLASMIIIYLQGRRTGTNIFIKYLSINQLYRLLVAIGVIFAVLLIIVFLHSMIAINMFNPNNPNVQALIEIQKNFLTIIGTAFASLVAFYFGTRASQGSNAEGTTAITKPEAGQKAPEVIDVNPIDGSMGVEVESPVTATFSAPVRSSSINPSTFSVKDANGNPIQGKITLTDNNTTIRFNPVPSLNRNSRYTITITRGLIDISGASIAADKEWHFTTVA